jgi:hypothetical protein
MRLLRRQRGGRRLRRSPARDQGRHPTAQKNPNRIGTDETDPGSDPGGPVQQQPKQPRLPPRQHQRLEMDDAVGLRTPD